VERAFRAVDRHRLLETFRHRTDEGSVEIRQDPERPRRERLEIIYADNALATRHIGGWPTSSTSQASLMARMLELLDLAEGMKMLEIGAGTGYNAALMAEIVGDQRLVTTVDVLADAVEQTRRLLTAAGYPGSGWCWATGSTASPKRYRLTGSWGRWDVQICRRAGPGSWPTTGRC
jgi:protein-L-isoaspartate(D-aspartate) O-methyltransferase